MIEYLIPFPLVAWILHHGFSFNQVKVCAEKGAFLAAQERESGVIEQLAMLDAYKDASDKSAAFSAHLAKEQERLGKELQTVRQAANDKFRAKLAAVSSSLANQAQKLLDRSRKRKSFSVWTTNFKKFAEAQVSFDLSS